MDIRKVLKTEERKKNGSKKKREGSIKKRDRSMKKKNGKQFITCLRRILMMI